MKSPSTGCFLLVISLTLLGSAQVRGTGGGARGPSKSMPSVSQPPLGTPPDSSLPSNLFLTGQVVVDDGTPVTESAAIQTVCRGEKHTETHTDSKGNFSFQFSGAGM